MLASITPLGQRGRGASWRRTVTAYLIASVLAGALLGAALGALGGWSLAGRSGPSRAGTIVVGALAVLAATADLTGSVPSRRRQVDENWLVGYRDWVHGAGFGFQLGLGALTITTSASLYLTWLLELLTASAPGGAVVGALFGAARAIPLLANRAVVDTESLRRVQRGWQDGLPRARHATVAVMVAAGALLIGVAAA